MDNNEYRPADHAENTDGLNETPGAQPNNAGAYNESGAPQYPPYGGYAPYGETPGARPRKRRDGTGRGFLIAIIMVLCLAVGGLVSAFVIVPAIQDGRGGEWLEQAAQPQVSGQLPDSSQPALLPGNDDAAPPAQSAPAQTTDNPDIGGQAPNIDTENNPIVQIAQEVGPAVVGVSVSVGGQGLDQQDFEMESGYGTGIILSEDGYIVTNNHVIAGSTSVKVTMIDGTDHPATVVGADKTTDLAVLKIDASSLTVAALGDSGSLLVGETVVAIGNPLGSDLAGSVTSGIVSALGREISTNGYSQEYIQTDAAINPGNSGGALVNIRGEVIGINTLKSYLAGYDDYGVPIGTEGIGFAIPINEAKPIIEQLMKSGKVERPGIGIHCLVDVTNTYNPEGSPEGVTVVDVVKGGPADKAGLQPSDIILTVAGETVETAEALTDEIRKHAVGDEVEMVVWRGGTEYRAAITLGDLNDM